jgi:hypothetical protein
LTRKESIVQYLKQYQKEVPFVAFKEWKFVSGKSKKYVGER